LSELSELRYLAGARVVIHKYCERASKAANVFLPSCTLRDATAVAGAAAELVHFAAKYNCQIACRASAASAIGTKGKIQANARRALQLCALFIDCFISYNRLFCNCLCLRAVVDFGDSRLFKQRWPSTSQLGAVTAAPEAMQTADAINDDEWHPIDFAAPLTVERKTRSEHLPSQFICEDLRDIAVKLCMLACGDALCLALFRCSSKAVELYDDTEVRDSILRAFGEVSRSQFEALCTKAYGYRKHKMTDLLLPRNSLEKIWGEKAQSAQYLFQSYKRTAELMPWEYWAISNAALLLEKSRRFTLHDRLVSNLTDEEYGPDGFYVRQYDENGQ
jgi:hypothetical protein